MRDEIRNVRKESRLMSKNSLTLARLEWFRIFFGSPFFGSLCSPSSPTVPGSTARWCDSRWPTGVRSYGRGSGSLFSQFLNNFWVYGGLLC